MGDNAKGAIRAMYGISSQLVKNDARRKICGIYRLVILSATLSLTNMSCIPEGQVQPEDEDVTPNNGRTMTLGASSSLEDQETDSDDQIEEGHE